MSLSDIVSLYNSNEELIGSGRSNVFSAKNVSILKYEYPRNLGPFKVYELEATGTLSVPSTAPVNLKAASGNSQVTLSWNAVDSAESYIVHYGTSSGNYTKTAVAIKDENGSFIISGLSNGTTYYFVVSSVVDGVESDFSNEAVATPQAVTQPNDPTPSGDRAILTITMTTGLQKEYDLSMDEINAFINWYDTKDAGSGPSKYAISKHDNNKGPFSKRTDYVIFSNILTFEVNEYNTVTAAIYK
ncbi:fibronectin type III domain-containing protein [Paenibacillus macerans]|uniref:fibronectin type III domain-containing protein n=1 Tax=Paenibacillus macerans TaxID=44252 RepID=UPI0012D8B36D|nr:fibronectin type III domain-containing protein [Paenibacillus macerans]